MRAYSVGRRRAVIVELVDPRTDRATRAARDAHARSTVAAQAPFLAEVAQVHATKVKPYSLINAFAATLPEAEIAHLASEPGVAAVVPDLPIANPSLARLVGSTGSTGSSPSAPANASAAAPSPEICPPRRDKPFLEPEALQLTHTAFTDPNVPQAQQIVDGAGVKVAFIADGLDPGQRDFFRANGEKVFVDYQDFSGDGIDAPTLGAEAFGDASAIAAQGRKVYFLSKFVNASHPRPNSCTIRVLGMAPGAQLVGLKAFGSSFGLTSSIVQAVDYAVEHDHVDVINESFGSASYPDDNTDPLSLADDAAVAAGVVVVTSTGDSGTANTIGSPASDPNLISVGGTTSFRAYAQTNAAGFGLTNGTYESNNISSLSSGGVTQEARTQDVVAPGDLGWALCSRKVIFRGCRADSRAQSNLQIFGGTSQSSPFTAGLAALVIEAYANSHGGMHPSPALVKQIITSTATDLGHPSYEQGAGLIDSLAAVQAAQSIADDNGTPPPVGTTLLVSPSQLSARAARGTSNTYAVRVTNNGAEPQTVSAFGRMQGPPVSQVRGQVHLDTSVPTPIYLDEFGTTRWYVIKHFNVPKGVDRLDAAIAARANPRSSWMRMTLIDPRGTLEAYSIPQGPGNYAHVDVRAPAAGSWTAIIADGSNGDGFDGPVHYEFTTSRFVPFGTVAPATQAIAPGETAVFEVALTTPIQPGDTSASLQLVGSLGTVESIPITLRSLIATNAAGGTFAGTFTGGNGRGFPGQSVSYDFDVPAGRHDLGVSLRLRERHEAVTGYLIDPEGEVVSTQSNLVGPPDASTYTSHMQMFARDPVPGRWELAFAVANPIFGANTTMAYSGALRYDLVDVTSAGVPSGAVVAAASEPMTATVTVTNSGSAEEQFFVDPRTFAAEPRVLVPATPARGIVLPMQAGAPPPRWSVPTETTALSLRAIATVPVQADLFCFEGNPEVLGLSVGNSSTAALTASPIAPGRWGANASEIGPYAERATEGMVDFTLRATTRGFDPTVRSSTGDVWLGTVDRSASAATPLTLAPGETGTITVTFVVPDAPGTVDGTLFVDDFNAATGSGDELAGIPYQYVVE